MTLFGAVSNAQRLGTYASPRLPASDAAPRPRPPRAQDLSGASFVGAVRLRRARRRSYVRGADNRARDWVRRLQDLTNANLGQCNLDGADLTGAPCSRGCARFGELR